MVGRVTVELDEPLLQAVHSFIGERLYQRLLALADED